MKLVVYQVDSFTQTIFEGNPASVVMNAEKLDDTQMQKIAREMNNSETAFIIPKMGKQYHLEVRFFTPTQEVPICGHATVAAHYVYSRDNDITDREILQKTKAGILPVYIKSEDGDRRIIMTQAKIEYGKIFSEKEQEILLRGLHLNHSELDASLPVQIVSTGHSKVMIPIRKKETLDSIRINPGILTDLSQKTGCNGYYAFTFDAQEEGILASGRMFAPAIGIHEDPVTGNANGPLGAYLTRHGRIPEKRQGYTFEIKQGEAIDRKGYMRVHVYSNDEGPQVVQVSGRARIVFKTHISI